MVWMRCDRDPAMPAKKNGLRTRSPCRGAEAKKGRDTKVQQLVDMLREPEGATVAQIAAVLHWQPHTVRAALSRFRKSSGLTITKAEQPDGQRTYRVID